MIQHWLSLVFIIVIVFDFVFASLWLSSTQIEMKLKSLEIQQLVRRLYKTWPHRIRHGQSETVRRTLGDTWLQFDSCNN